MTPEEAYAEALGRVRKAKATGASALNLSRVDFLRRLPQELAGLTPNARPLLLRAAQRRLNSAGRPDFARIALPEGMRAA